MSEARKFYQLVHPGGPGGALLHRPRMKRNQDKRFKSAEFYAVAFFPKITGIGPARGAFYEIAGTLSQSPEAAKTKFMDRIAQSETWETYHDAGHRVRKVRIVDLGDA